MSLFSEQRIHSKSFGQVQGMRDVQTVSGLEQLLSQNAPFDVRIPSSFANSQQIDDCFPGLFDALKTHFPKAMSRITSLRWLSHVDVELLTTGKKKLRMHLCYKLARDTPMPDGYAVFKDQPAKEHWSLFPVVRPQPVSLLENTTLALALPVLQLPWAICCFILRASAEPKADAPDTPPSDLFRLAALLHEHFHVLPEDTLSLVIHVQDVLEKEAYPDFSELSPEDRLNMKPLVHALRWIGLNDDDDDLLERLSSQVDDSSDVPAAEGRPHEGE